MRSKLHRVVPFRVPAGLCLVAVGVLGLVPVRAPAPPAWSIVPSPNLAKTYSILYGVSCTSAKACTSVGVSENPAFTDVTLAEVWNGTDWKIRSSPSPGPFGSELAGVSCTSVKACTAVGASTDQAGAHVTLVEAWNGTKWTIKPSPDPSAALNSHLSSVSCTSAKACTAVGYEQNSVGKDLTLVEAWNGTKWAIKPSPNPHGALSSYLSGVSCTSAKACTAVGSYEKNGGASETLVEAWNGKRWAIEPSPNPTGPSDSYLSAVSCTSTKACTAVGGDPTAGLSVTLAEGWNGKKWVIEPTTDPSGNGSLTGVSCTSAAACVAVGSYDKEAHGGVTLVEGWNRKRWATEPTPNPSGARDSFLTAVSCPSTAACVTGGFIINEAGNDVTLVEHD